MTQERTQWVVEADIKGFFNPVCHDHLMGFVQERVSDAGGLRIIRQFANGRSMAANLRLTPREHSSGGKQRLMGISKRGNTYLRTLLIHGARRVLRHVTG